MDAREFMKLAGELKLEDVPAGGTGLQGPAKDISRFLAAGDPTVDHLFLGVYATMMAAGLDRVRIVLDGEGSIEDTTMDGTQVRLRIAKDTLTLERLPDSEAAASSPDSAKTEDSLTLERVPADEEVKND